MNGKRAKLMRRLAEKGTIGKPAVNYLHSSNGKDGENITLSNSTKAAYRQIKRSARKTPQTVTNAWLRSINNTLSS